MSFSLEWVAMRGKEPRSVWAAMGLQSTGKRGHDCPLYAMTPPSGWHLVVAHTSSNYSPSLLDVIPRVSRGAEAFHGAVVESTDYSQLTAWRDGVRVWSVIHDALNQLGLKTEGELPDIFEALAQKHADEPSEIAVELGQQLIGYRYDVDEGTPAEELLVTAATRLRIEELGG
jgi:hypothetical protein